MLLFLVLLPLVTADLSPEESMKVLLKYGFAGKMKFLNGQFEKEGEWNEDTSSLAGGDIPHYRFEPAEIDEVLGEIAFKLKVGGVFRAPNELSRFESLMTYEHMVAPYRISSDPEKHAAIVDNFLDQVFTLNMRNPIISGFLTDLESRWPHRTWPDLIKASLAEGAKTGCTTRNTRTSAIRLGMHMALVWDSLTRDMYHDPTGFMQAAEMYLLGYLKSLDPAKRLDLTGSSLFFIVKFPSVLKPIHEFVKAKVEAAGRIPGSRPHALLEEAAELEEDGWFEDAIMETMTYIIDEDPTIALRKNIYEAAYANIVQFAPRPALLTASQPPGYERSGIPGSAIGGLVIANDMMMGGLQPGDKCGADCIEVFADGRFTFSNSMEWMDIYNGWNLAFMLSMSDMAEWIPKLVTPAVVEDLSGESYIIRRTIALWLTLFRNAFKQDGLQRSHRCMSVYLNGDSLEMSGIMGRQVGIMADDYMRKYWHSCPRCSSHYHSDSNGMMVGLLRRFARFF